ncbi:MAG TPA: capsular polysaccharide biosynthesis protein [Xanthobacteraceae bacterium]|nr:capsular polysaccharide biosynthesis protein [Xanthobacteraceae bacterium]
MASRTSSYGLLRGPQSWPVKQPISVPEDPERWLRRDDWRSESLLARARDGIAGLISARLGGDCWAPDPGSAPLGLPARAAIVVLPDKGDFVTARAGKRMLAAVCREQIASKVVLVAVARAGPLWRSADAIARKEGWILVTQKVSPWTLLDAAAVVYTTDHEIGFLALLARITVKCFLPSFYTGWGLTDDDAAIVPRQRELVVPELFAAACLLATRYTDPFTGRASQFEQMCSMLAEWRQVERTNRQLAVCLGISFWKRRFIRNFLRTGDASPVFCRGARQAVAVARARGGAIAVWASREPQTLTSLARKAGIRILRIEDGFLRSVGLGADFIPGASIVVDDQAPYFDPAKPSTLEILLGETRFDLALCARADRLVGELVRLRISKYNTGITAKLDIPPHRLAIFVPGQVEDDCSVVRGGAGIVGNLDLLARVRAENTDAFIVYKPHPDVDAGHRRGGVPDYEIRRYADNIVRGISSLAVIAAVDEVHTLTSLCGFEALLRGRRVVVYGQPFYAGWGLTVDLAPIPRRRRRLTLSELVAGTLILYPRYLDPVTQLPCRPELVIERLSNPDLWRSGLLVRMRRVQGVLLRPFRARPSLVRQRG